MFLQQVFDRLPFFTSYTPHFFQERNVLNLYYSLISIRIILQLQNAIEFLLYCAVNYFSEVLFRFYTSKDICTIICTLRSQQGHNNNLSSPFIRKRTKKYGQMDKRTNGQNVQKSLSVKESFVSWGDVINKSLFLRSFSTQLREDLS